MKNLKSSNISINDIPTDILICRLIDDRFIIVDGNDTAANTIGIPKDEFIGKDIFDLLEELDETDFLTILYKAYNSSKIIEFNTPCYINNNLCRWYKGSIKRVFNGDLMLYFKNIEKEKELEVEELEQQFELISEAPYVGITIFDDKFLYVNHVLEEILGYSFEELQKITPLDSLYLENKEKHKRNLQKRFAGENFTTSYLEGKLLTKDRAEVFVRLCVKTVKYRGAYRALASVIDITNIVVQEQKTKRLAQALEQTDDLLLMTDVEGKMIYVNQQLVDKMGYSKEELIGNQTNIFKSGKHSQRFYKRLWDTILSGNKYSNLIINRTKAGKLIYLDITITPVFDKEGKLESFVSTSKDVTYQIKTKTRLKNLAMIDTLTKTLNRYAIDREMTYYISVAQRHSVPFSLLMLDIDYFKKINDSYGHYTGDVVLKNISKLMSKNIRKIDKLGRWGGEEFIIILHTTSEDIAKKIAEKLRKVIENHTIDTKYKITASIGVTSYKEGDTKKSLLARVDDALYRAKKKGRNRVVAL